jgi:hypothetical protein
VVVANILKIAPIGLAATILSGAALADTLHQFDLICTGKTRTVTGSKAPEQWSWHLSVDLDTGRWCGHARGCADVYKIARSQPDVIELAHRQTYYDQLGISFAPQTGRIVWSYDYNASNTYLSEGKCEVVPFTAFPTSSHMSDETGPEIEPPPAPR